MTRENMIDMAVRRSMARTSMLAVCRRVRKNFPPFGCMPRRLEAIRAEFRRIAAA